MKKIKLLIFAIVILSITILSSIWVRAETLPVKKGWIDNGVFVLAENGNLYYGESLYSQNKDILLQNVNEVVYVQNEGYAYFILDSGRFGKFSCDYRFEKDKFDENIKYYEGYKASEIIPVSEYRFFFIDNNTLYYYKDGLVEKLYDKGIKKVFSSGAPGELDEYIFILTNDSNVLLYKGGTRTIELENIRELYDNYGIYAISYTDDLYVFDWDYNNKSYLPSIIRSNVKQIFTRNDSWLPLIDNNNDLYFYNTAKYTTDLVAQNAKDVFCVDGRYAVISIDNTLYDLDIEYNHHKKQYDYETNIIKKNIKELVYINGRRYFVNSINNELFTGFYGSGANVKLNAIKTEINDVRLIHSNGDGVFKTDNFLIIKNDGSVWGASFYNNEQKSLVETIYGQKKLKLLFNNKEIELKHKVQNVNNRTMYPFRECLEAFGAKVIWDGVNNCAIGKLNEKTVEFPIGKQEYYVDGIKYEMDTTTYIDNSLGRTYIPLRYAAEGLGFTVDWIEEETENIISIHK